MQHLSWTDPNIAQVPEPGPNKVRMEAWRVADSVVRAFSNPLLTGGAFSWKELLTCRQLRQIDLVDVGDEAGPSAARSEGRLRVGRGVLLRRVRFQ